MSEKLSPAERTARALPCAYEDEELPRDLIPWCSYHKGWSDEFPERCGQYVCPWRYRRAVAKQIAEAVAEERKRVLAQLDKLYAADPELVKRHGTWLRAAIESGATDLG